MTPRNAGRPKGEGQEAPSQSLPLTLSEASIAQKGALDVSHDYERLPKVGRGAEGSRTGPRFCLC